MELEFVHRSLLSCDLRARLHCVSNGHLSVHGKIFLVSMINSAVVFLANKRISYCQNDIPLSPAVAERETIPEEA
jgi:hypothetical protein